MKNLILIAAFGLSIISTSFGFSNNPVNDSDERTIFSSANISCLVLDITNKAIINEVTFSAETEDVYYNLKEEISFVQIFNSNNELEFQLPVGSKKVHITLDTFIAGAYEVIFLTKENKAIKTELNKI